MVHTLSCRVVGAVVAAVLLSGCGGTTAVQAGDAPAPAATGTPDPPGLTAAESACVHRNDEVVPWREYDEPGDLWHVQGAQDAHKLIIQAVYRHIGATYELEPEKALARGFEGYDLVVVDRRLIMLVDSARMDLPAFRRWVQAYAAKANRAAHVRGRPLTVTVQPACFPAGDIAKLKRYLRKNFERLDLGEFEGDVALDGRIHGSFCDQDAGHRAQRTFHALAVDGCVRTHGT